jgi:hypothetical protein
MGTLANILPMDTALNLHNDRPEGILSFLASRARSSTRTLTPSVNEVFKGCSEETTALLRNMIATRTRVEFRRELAAAFPKYLALNLAVSYFARAVIARDSLERLNRESICEIEADFRDKGLAAFGAAVRNQALFTVWTLRKIHEIVTQINSVKIDDSKKSDDAAKCTQFIIHEFRAQFSLDCLRMALNAAQPVYPEVSEELVDGLRSMVNAYAWARQGLALRNPSEELPLTVPPMDDESCDLLDAAMENASELIAEGL